MTEFPASTEKLTISAIVSCYNQAHFLEECLDSIITQSFPVAEIILIDDQSPDSDEISQVVMASNDSRISTLKHDINRGLGASRNTGARASSGELLLFVDADDILRPTFCERLVDCFSETPDLDIAFSAFELFGAMSHIAFLSASEYNSWELELKMYIPGPGVLMRRSVWERVGGYCEHPLFRFAMEDRDFWIATIPLALKEAHIPEPLYRWRRYAGTLSSPERLEKIRYKLSRTIVRRHIQTFRANHTIAPYLADAYFRSAKAYRKDGHRLKALYLASRGLMYSHTEYQHRLQWLELVHPALPNLWQRLKGSVRRQKRES